MSHDVKILSLPQEQIKLHANNASSNKGKNRTGIVSLPKASNRQDNTGSNRSSKLIEFIMNEKEP